MEAAVTGNGGGDDGVAVVERREWRCVVCGGKFKGRWLFDRGREGGRRYVDPHTPSSRLPTHPLLTPPHPPYHSSIFTAHIHSPKAMSQSIYLLANTDTPTSICPASHILNHTHASNHTRYITYRPILPSIHSYHYLILPSHSFSQTIHL
ncbi:hypothetical protein E2C01_071690 [Portunus trituberculatus]|uniref:Uncharacterized protein n=1 Tax=Portunus trituberculatus TaxID=210409 RepID=A0A5B7HVZ3_PORTR|nr:hypothetical protein [Portunus trituberculatus]